MPTFRAQGDAEELAQATEGERPVREEKNQGTRASRKPSEESVSRRRR